MSEKVLLVDDERGIRKVLGLTLADMGFQVFTAENGHAALEIFTNESPPIVFTDIKMPGMDGIALLRHIKQSVPDTEVIMISGHGDMDLAIESLKLEACDFITKPINDDALEIALKRATEKIAMRRQLAAYTSNLEALVAEKTAKLIEIERTAAVNQAVEGFSTAMSRIADDLESGFRYFNEMPCFVAIHDASHRIVAVNPLYAERIGERIGEKSGSSYRCADRDPAACPVARTFSTGKGQRSRQSVCYRDGREGAVMVHTAPIRNSAGQVELVVEIAVDITETRRLQEALASTQHRYRQLFDAVPCYISVQNRDLEIIDANRRFKAQFDAAAGRHCYKAYKDREVPCDACPVEKTFADGKSHQAEMAVVAKSGERHKLLVQTAPLTDDKGDITRVIEMATDITQLRRLQDNLAELGLMVGTISHSIKGVLTGLDAGLYFLDAGMTRENREKMAEGVEMVRLMVDRIRNVVLNILYYAKDRELKCAPEAVSAFLDDIRPLVLSKINGRAIRLTFDVDASAGQFEIDAVLVKTALTNVLENAVEACVADTSRSGHTVALSARATGGEVEIRITDDGVGMGPETLDKLFTLFFSSKGHAGTGLGMFIARHIIERHGGTIHASSVPGKGTTFSIRLPRQPGGAGGWKGRECEG